MIFRAETTVISNTVEAFAPVLSETCTVKLKGPMLPVIVPLITPVAEFNIKPPGRLPFQVLDDSKDIMDYKVIYPPEIAVANG